jgi:hypothetical protein
MKQDARTIIIVSALAVCIIGVGSYWTLKRSQLPQTLNQQTTTSSNVVVNPKTGKSDPELEKWINSVTNEQGNAIYINLGDRAGGLGSEDDAKLSIFLLSPVLRKYSNASIFTVSWSYNVAMGEDRVNIVYDRTTQTITSSSGGRGKPVTPDATPITGVTDSMIHSAASNYDSYTNVKSYS